MSLVTDIKERVQKEEYGVSDGNVMVIRISPTWFHNLMMEPTASEYVKLNDEMTFHEFQGTPLIIDRTVEEWQVDLIPQSKEV